MIIPKFAEALCENCDAKEESLESLKSFIEKFKDENKDLDLFNFTLDLIMENLSSSYSDMKSSNLFYHQQLVDATVGDEEESKQFVSGYSRFAYSLIKESYKNKLAYNLMAVLTRSFMFMSSSWTKIVIGVDKDGKLLETLRPLDKQVKALLTKKNQKKNLNIIENSLFGSVLPFTMSCGIMAPLLRTEEDVEMFYTSFNVFNYEVSHVSESSVRQSLIDSRQLKVKDADKVFLSPVLVRIKNDEVFDRLLIYPIGSDTGKLNYAVRVSGIAGINYHFIFNVEDGKLWSVLDLLELYSDKDGIFHLNKHLKEIVLDVLYFILCRQKKSPKWDYVTDKPTLHPKKVVSIDGLFEELGSLVSDLLKVEQFDDDYEPQLQGVN